MGKHSKQKLTPEVYAAIEEHLLGLMEGANVAYAKMRSCIHLDENGSIAASVTYWRNVKNALRWALHTAKAKVRNTDNAGR